MRSWGCELMVQEGKPLTPLISPILSWSTNWSPALRIGLVKIEGQTQPTGHPNRGNGPLDGTLDVPAKVAAGWPAPASMAML